jgi:hypothetical protein
VDLTIATTPTARMAAALLVLLFAAGHLAATEGQPAKAFAIQDKRLAPKPGSRPCKTDAQLESSPSGYLAGGQVEMQDGQFALFCDGALHTWIGSHRNVEGAGITLVSDRDDPLQFRVDASLGYVYVKGKGTVTLADGTSTTLPPGAPGPSAGPVPVEWEGTSEWPGLRFDISFARAAGQIGNLKVAVTCLVGQGGIEASLAAPVAVGEDGTFTFKAGQGSAGTGRFVSAGSAEGTYKFPFSLKCGEAFQPASGPWRASPKKK